MKGGRTPIHIMRWAPADYHADEHVKLLKRRRAYKILTFYRHFLDFSYLAGGDLPSDPQHLAAVLEMPSQDVRDGLAFCLGRLIEEDGGRLYQKRVRRDVVAELDFREAQREHGKKGGRPTNKATLSGPESPPSPSPAPNARRQTPENGGPPANPLLAGRRPALEQECLALVREVAGLTGEDPVEVIAQASGYKGAATTKLNPATMSDDRLANTVRDLRSDAAELRKRKGAHDTPAQR